MKRVKQLLLVEDDPASAFLVQLMIEDTGIAESIVLCQHGQQALDYLYNCLNQKIQIPQLILLDLNMPVMDGYDFLKEFMEIEELKDKNIHVVILSSASKTKELARIDALPASGYIEKPIDEDKLSEVLDCLNF